MNKPLSRTDTGRSLRVDTTGAQKEQWVPEPLRQVVQVMTSRAVLKGSYPRVSSIHLFHRIISCVCLDQRPFLPSFSAKKYLPIIQVF